MSAPGQLAAAEPDQAERTEQHAGSDAVDRPASDERTSVQTRGALAIAVACRSRAAPPARRASDAIETVKRASAAADTS